MRIYYTKQYKKIGDMVWIFSGPSIFAVNDDHAKMALRHIGHPDFMLTSYEELAQRSPDLLVEWDSVIYPNDLQRN